MKDSQRRAMFYAIRMKRLSPHVNFTIIQQYESERHKTPKNAIRSMNNIGLKRNRYDIYAVAKTPAGEYVRVD